VGNNGAIPIRLVFDHTIDSRHRAENLVLAINILIDKIV
ncbi:uncharacterized protein METZ01_LOCUS119029, partial [marine metagenome]